MANKYYLIPKDLYDDLNKTEPENLNIDFERKEVEKSKNIRKKDVKNLLYNQELKRYIKLKKEQDNKPIRVELTNGAKLLTKKQPILRFSNQSYLLNNNDNADSDDNETLINTSAEYQSAVDETPKSSHTPIIFSKNHPENRLYQYILSNRKKFNISLDNQIFHRSGNRIIKNSDLKASIIRLLNPSTENAPSPPGTAQLLSKINKDTITKRYFSLGRDFHRGKRLGLNQSGHGIKKSLIHKSLKLSPQLWK
jgi:hypothetical protein